MRLLFKSFLLLVLLGPLAIGVIAYLALSDTPLVVSGISLSHQDIARARSILRRHDPRRLPPGSRRTIELGGQDLNLAANYLLQTAAVGQAELTLAEDRLHLRTTSRVPLLPWRHYLNTDSQIAAEQGRPVIRALRVGEVHIPGNVARWIAGLVLRASSADAAFESATEAIEELQILPDRVRLSYLWNPGLIDQARDTLLTDGDRQALRFYHDQLVELQAQGIGRSGSLVDLLPPLFALAQKRSQETDPVAENVALLTVLGTWASRRNLASLVPGNLARPQRFRLRLERRIDLAQHFLSSAALAARGDSALSDAVGLFKEIADTDRGSGFSFTDIAADRAGTRFGALATASSDDARRVQGLMAAGIDETIIMPRVGDLPEHLDAQSFKQAFGNVGSPPYQRVMDDIEQRISGSPLYHD